MKINESSVMPFALALLNIFQKQIVWSHGSYTVYTELIFSLKAKFIFLSCTLSSVITQTIMLIIPMIFSFSAQLLISADLVELSYIAVPFLYTVYKVYSSSNFVESFDKILAVYTHTQCTK